MNGEEPKAMVSVRNDLAWFLAGLMCVPVAVVLTLWLADLVGSKNTPAPVEPVVINEGEQRLLQSRAKAGEWMASANAVFNYHDWGFVRLVAPESSKSTNELLTLPNFQHALNSVPERELAVISTYALGFDMNALTNAVMQLRQCGFREVRITVFGWGAMYAGPEL